MFNLLVSFMILLPLSTFVKFKFVWSRFAKSRSWTWTATCKQYPKLFPF